MRRIIFIPVLVVVALFAIAGGVTYLLWNNYNYYSTDDAQVSGQTVTISSPAAGQLSGLNVQTGTSVTAGEVLASVATTGATGAKSTVNITSPIDGTVVQTSAVNGQIATPGLSLVQVTNLKNLYITAYVDEGQMNNIKINQSVDITIDAYSGTSYTGHIQQIVQSTASQFSLLPSTDYTSGNFTKVGQRVPVIVAIDGGNSNDIVPGMSAEVKIHLH
jgi:multidrug resistance efflux pump